MSLDFYPKEHFAETQCSENLRANYPRREAEWDLRLQSDCASLVRLESHLWLDLASQE
jgi:hypothetical protein